MDYSIGVIIPVYNTERYLVECLDSVINQRSLFDEVILVNDGSFDNSRRICEQYCEKYSYFKLINQENQGLGTARNNGMLLLESDYFIFLDSDDYINLQTVELLKKKLDNQDVVFYSSRIKEDIEGISHSNFYIRNENLCNYIMSGLEYFYHSFPENYIVSSCMAIYKRQFIYKNNILFPEGIYYEDNYFYIELIAKAKVVECIADQLYIRRYRPNSIMTSIIDKKKCLDKINVQYKIWDYIRINISLNWRKDILYNYLLQGIYEVVWTIQQCENISDFNRDKILFFEKFLYYWEEQWEFVLTTLDDYYILFIIYVELKKVKGYYEKKYKKIKSLFINKLKEKLENLCLNKENTKIGIYGIGNHTHIMLDLYEQYIGEIKCDYFYIVSEINLETEKEKYKIVSYKNIPEDTDLIIISSLIYMNTMIENLKKVKINNKKIHQIYNKREKLDLVVINDFIKKNPDCIL